jgi:alpha-tubulin suppressor-like RCC1 family protein
VRSNGTVVAWGFNNSGQTNVPINLTNGLAVSGGFAHSLALRKNGAVIGWGLNGHNQTNVLSDLTNVVRIAAGGFHNLVIVNSSSVIPPPPWFDTSSLGKATNGFKMRVKGLLGRGFAVLQGSSNSINWDFVSLRSSAVGDTDFLDSSATNHARRFYRVSESR